MRDSPEVALFAVGIAVACGDSTALAPRDDVGESAPERATSLAQVSLLEDAFRDAMQRAAPAVVSVHANRTAATVVPFGGDLLPWFLQPPTSPSGAGSGLVLDATGHVLASAHVVAGLQTAVVALADGREAAARVVGVDPLTDLAVLHVDAEGLEPAGLGATHELAAGQWVLAIGSTTGGRRRASAGIVSATPVRDVPALDPEAFIQSDAAMHPGSAGGPLVDLDGRVVGINTVRDAMQVDGVTGVSFAIPIEVAQDVATQLIRTGEVMRSYAGLYVTELSRDLAATFDFSGRGLLVQDVTAGGPAERGGVRPGDLIEELDDRSITSAAAFRRAVAARAPGERVELWVRRGEENHALTIELAQLTVPESTESTVLGLRLVDLDAARSEALGGGARPGALVTEVEPGSLADRGGLQPGDLIEHVGDDAATSAAQTLALLGGTAVTRGVRLRIRRAGVGAFLFLRAAAPRLPTAATP